MGPRDVCCIGFCETKYTSRVCTATSTRKHTHPLLVSFLLSRLLHFHPPTTPPSSLLYSRWSHSPLLPSIPSFLSLVSPLVALPLLPSKPSFHLLAYLSSVIHRSFTPLATVVLSCPPRVLLPCAPCLFLQPHIQPPLTPAVPPQLHLPSPPPHHLLSPSFTAIFPFLP